MGTKKFGDRKNTSGNRKNDNRRKQKQDGLNLSGLSKFMR